ncbi:deoxyribose-phosphate aldolase [Halanaerobaculum tunisiense]
MENEEIASTIDHTILSADATAEEIIEKCQEAIGYQFASVCINPNYVSLARKELKDSSVKVCTVIGFPLGNTLSEVKAYETKKAIENGAQEVDMVINLGALKSGDWALVKEDIKAVVEAAGQAITKVIIETCYLTQQEKKRVCRLAKEAEVDFVKTSTGFGTAGATLEDVKLMKKIVEKKVGVKASGGIKNKKDAQDMIEAGADRIGASSGVEIVTGQESTSSY